MQMIRYHLREDYLQSEDNISYISYGIDIVSDNTILKSIKDVSLQKKPLEELITLCNELRLSELHIYDVIDDFLSV